MSLRKIIATTLMATGITAGASEAKADFWDGYRGPMDAQLDARLSLNCADDACSQVSVNTTVLPKVFIPLGKDDGGLFGVVPVSYTLDQNSAVGLGVGGWYQFKHGSVLGVTPVVYDIENKAVNFNPTLYATFQAGKYILIDLRASYLLRSQGGTLTHMLGFGTTLGFRYKYVTVGIDLDANVDTEHATPEQVRQGLTYGGILRFDTVRTAQGKPEQWLELVANNRGAQVQYRVNFDW